MRHQTLGRSGLRVSTMGLGCSALGARLDQTESDALVDAAIDAGISWFDTADNYSGGGGELALGRALRGRRDQVVLATKGRWPTGPGPNDRGASRIHLRAAVEASLRRLGTDRIDLYQVHAPDPATPLEETVGVLDDLIRQGKILYAGLSNFNGWQLVEAYWQGARLRPGLLVSTQTTVNLVQLDARRELLPAARHCGIGVIACLVLARGFLSGSDEPLPGQTWSAKRRAYLTAANRARLAVLRDFAAELGTSVSQLSIAAVAAIDGVQALVIGASAPAQVIANAQAAAQSLSATDLDELNRRLAMTEGH